MKHDYGPYTPAPPSAEAIARRDRLAEEFAAAAPGSPARKDASRSLVDHWLTVGGRWEEFSTPSGRTFAIRLSRPNVLPDDVRRWLAGRDFVKAVKELLYAGTSLPQHVLDHVHYVVSEKK
jgi:hypothetical protein